MLPLLLGRPGWRAGYNVPGKLYGNPKPAWSSLQPALSFSTLRLPACCLSHHPWSPLIKGMCITSVLPSPLFCLLGTTLHSHLHGFLPERPLHVCQTLTGGVFFPELPHYPPWIIQLNYLKNLSVKQQEITNSKWPMQCLLPQLCTLLGKWWLKSLLRELNQVQKIQQWQKLLQADFGTEESAMSLIIFLD